MGLVFREYSEPLLLKDLAGGKVGLEAVLNNDLIYDICNNLSTISVIIQL